jgi:hypothetical protein
VFNLSTRRVQGTTSTSGRLRNNGTGTKRHSKNQPSQVECLSDICDADGVEFTTFDVARHQRPPGDVAVHNAMASTNMPGTKDMESLVSVPISRSYTHKVRIYDKEVDKTIGPLDLLGQPTLGRTL